MKNKININREHWNKWH